MNQVFQETLWKNFAAVIDMLRNIIVMCPEEIWQKDRKFFYITYHTVIFLDYHLTRPVKDFHPILPYTITVSDHLPADSIDDVIPKMQYTKQEFLDCISMVRDKCKELIMQTPFGTFTENWINADEADMHDLCPPHIVNYSLLEILFYSFRHTQHHVAQLNLLLRQKANIATDWISHAD